MTDLEKLRVMLPHWIEHNQGHGEEFSQWEGKLVTETPEVAALLRRAIDSLQEAQAALEEALTRAGGPLKEAVPQNDHRHSHSGDGHHHHH